MTAAYIYPNKRLKAIESLVYANKASFIKRFLKETQDISLLGFGSKEISIGATDNERFVYNTYTITVKEFIDWRNSL